MDEHWSRGCGSGGVGFVAESKAYTSGVCIGNWVEDLSGADMQREGQHLLGEGGVFRDATTQRISYNPVGKVGEDLLNLTPHPSEGIIKNSGTGKELLFKHGDMTKPRIEAFATMYQLTHGQGPQFGAQRPQDMTWCGSKFNDYGVPIRMPTGTGTVRVTKKDPVEAAVAADPEGHMKSTTRATLIATALEASAPGSATRMPTAKKTVGEFASELDKDYNKIGLRTVYA